MFLRAARMGMGEAQDGTLGSYSIPADLEGDMLL